MSDTAEDDGEMYGSYHVLASYLRKLNSNLIRIIPYRTTTTVPYVLSYRCTVLQVEPPDLGAWTTWTRQKIERILLQYIVSRQLQGAELDDLQETVTFQAVVAGIEGLKAFFLK